SEQEVVRAAARSLAAGSRFFAVVLHPQLVVARRRAPGGAAGTDARGLDLHVQKPFVRAPDRLRRMAGLAPRQPACAVRRWRQEFLGARRADPASQGDLFGRPRRARSTAPDAGWQDGLLLTARDGIRH